jgi:predicted XRE-type DNA-binding protein
MKNGKQQTEAAIEIEESSGNVFADLGLPNADELLTKARAIGAIHGAIKEGKLTDKMAAGLLGLSSKDLDAILRGDLEDRYSNEELSSMHRNLNEIRAATRKLEEEIQRAAEKVAEVNPVIRRLRKTRNGDRVIGEVVDACCDSDGAWATYSHAAIQVPGGVGVLRYTIEAGTRLDEHAEDETHFWFVPFNKCEPSWKAKLLPSIDDLVEGLKRNVVEKKRPRARISR